MTQPVPAARGDGKALVAACVAAVIAAFPATVYAATGTWTIVQSPNPSTPGAYALSDVTCVGASDCWAVGSGSYNSGGGQTLIEHNAGSGWVIVPSPNPGNSVAIELTGATCVSASDCWAVGDYLNGSGVSQTLIEQYNGSSWTIVSSPDPGTDQNLLFGVKCVNATSCWAVGHIFTSGVAQTLIEQYTGGKWVVVANGLSNAFLQDVTCLSLSSDCWAVGQNFGPACTTPGHGCTLIEHNTGSGWVIVASPNFPTAWDDSLSGVTCVSASNCWTVGFYTNSQRTKFQTLTEHYDGIGWTIVASSNILNPGDVLTDVSCVSANDCWAVGYRGAMRRTLIEQNTGSGWVIVKSPNASTLNNFLLGIECVTAGCWAVGGHVAATLPFAEKTLVEHHA